jgi:LacI family transcriptional regulator
VSVVGFDDFRLISEALDPGLTTVALPYREIGELAARQALGTTREAGVVRVPCRAVVRGTVTKPAGGQGSKR